MDDSDFEKLLGPWLGHGPEMGTEAANRSVEIVVN